MLGKESIIELGEMLNTRIRVKLNGREVSGVLKAFDRVPNLVLDESIEVSLDNRELGIVIVRGQMISAILPDKVEEIENPFK